MLLAASNHRVARRVGVVACTATLLASLTGVVSTSAASSRTANPTFCQSADDAFSSSANAIPASLPPASLVNQDVILLDTIVGAYNRLVARTSSSASKTAYQHAEADFRRALSYERGAQSHSSSSDQRIASSQFREGLALVISAPALAYRSCAGMKSSVASLIAQSVSWNAITTAAKANRVVATSDLRTAARSSVGVTLVEGVSNTARVAKFRIALASSVAGDYCVLEPTTVRGSTGRVSAC